jgi:hypothetical protein
MRLARKLFKWPYDAATCPRALGIVSVPSRGRLLSGTVSAGWNAARQNGATFLTILSVTIDCARSRLQCLIESTTMLAQKPGDDRYFLGGHDLEMVTIGKLLSVHGADFRDAGLRWGARASAYGKHLASAVAEGCRIVLVELEVDIELPRYAEVVIIDHHGLLAGKNRPTSLEQVANRLGITAETFAANRWWQLVSANDRGHVRAMRELSPAATDDEVRTVRQLDLTAQGIGRAEMVSAREAAKRARRVGQGRLTIAECSDDRTGLVAEMLEPFFGGAGYENLLVVGQTQFGFYGSGQVVTALAERSPADASWFGGSLPDYGYWGAERARISFDPAQMIAEQLQSQSKD